MPESLKGSRAEATEPVLLSFVASDFKCDTKWAVKKRRESWETK
jgi:hypothetical protein